MFSSFHTGQSTEAAWLKLVATIDPASELAQRWSAILRSMAELPGVHVQVILNPLTGQRELPVKRFYRDAFRSLLTFDKAGCDPLSLDFAL